MSYIIPPPSIVGLPVLGTDALFPVRRVYCVGRNYAAHAREMGFDPEREPPFFFCKPNDDASIVPVPLGVTVDIPYPPLTENYHHEIELGRRGGARANAGRTHRGAGNDSSQGCLNQCFSLKGRFTLASCLHKRFI